MSTKCPAGTIAYTIVAGDTIYSLAIKYHTSVQQILTANPGINPNLLQIGQVICIPSQKPTPPCTGTLYTIKAGDTLYDIARRSNTTVNALIAANPGISPTALKIGQVICIPGTGPGKICPPNTFAYTIKAGDNFYQLAIKYNTSVSAIGAANPGVNPNRLQIGQQICIPR